MVVGCWSTRTHWTRPSNLSKWIHNKRKSRAHDEHICDVIIGHCKENLHREKHFNATTTTNKEEHSKNPAAHMAKHIGDVSLAHFMCTRKRMQKVECIYRSVGKKARAVAGWDGDRRIWQTKWVKRIFVLFQWLVSMRHYSVVSRPISHWRRFRHATSTFTTLHIQIQWVWFVCIFCEDFFLSSSNIYKQTHTHNSFL